MEQGNDKNEGDNAAAEGLAQSQASEKKTPNLWKSKSDIAKSMAKNFLKTRKGTNTSEVRRRKQKKRKKSISEGNKATENDAMKQNSREENPRKDATTSMVVRVVENSQQIRKNEENTHASGSKEKSSKSNGRKRRRGEGDGVLNKNRKNEEKHRGKKKRKRNEWVEKHKNEENSGGKGTKQENEMKKTVVEREENPRKDATTSLVHVENSQLIRKNEENTHGPDVKEKSSKSNGSPGKKRRGKGAGLLNKNRKNEEKQRGTGKRKRNEQVEKHKNEENSGGKGRKQENKTNEKICGLIFLCNAKTKTDCFRYRVMGLSDGKKDLVLSVRQGYKLFLYDYDLKLMYGIYKADTSGNMNIEPEAFGGAFPAQVRFSIQGDYFPVAESIFKKAIKENYNKNNKFKTELTATQVRKLSNLFRPLAVHSTALHVRSPPSTRAAARIFEHPKNREARDRPREARPPSDRETSSRDQYANINPRSYPVLSHERDRQIAYGELPSARRDDIHRDLYLNGNGYRADGFQGERRHSSFQTHMAPRLVSYHRDYEVQPLSYHRDYELQPLRQPDMVYRESVPMQRDTVPSNPLYLTEREYRTYDLVAPQEMQSTVSASTPLSYSTDPYYSRYYGPSLDSYLPRSGDQVDSSYARYTADALAEYDQRHRHQDVMPVPASSSVSHRYSFTGGSFSYR